MRDGRPHVLVKLAVSSDGKAGLAGRRPAAITGEAARARVHRMRAASDAILVGIGTVLADDPHLTCRLPGMGERSPVRVVLDARLRVPLASSVVATAGETPTWVVAAPSASPVAEDILRAKGVEVIRVVASGGALDLTAVLKALAERGVTRLMVEGGPTVAAAFVNAGLVDEVALFHSPNPLGADAIDGLEGLPLDALTRALTPIGSEPVGDDRLEHFERGS
jgi:diaminohydroxyphosphoribosylaminopyrimidine deaminase/5-amino-6-(5-phosphoribosylamino)uracil reductase